MFLKWGRKQQWLNSYHRHLLISFSLHLSQVELCVIVDMHSTKKKHVVCVKHD